MLTILLDLHGSVHGDVGQRACPFNCTRRLDPHWFRVQTGTQCKSFVHIQILKLIRFPTPVGRLVFVSRV